jgi:hypothetical protein
MSLKFDVGANLPGLNYGADPSLAQRFLDSKFNRILADRSVALPYNNASIDAIVTRQSTRSKTRT